jgi:signal transduction histidine kinase
MGIGSILAAYITLAHNLPYPRFLARLALNYALFLLLAVLLAWLGFSLLLRLNQILPRFGVLIIALAFALGWVATFRLLQHFSPRWVDRLIPATRYDLNQVLSEYSQSVSNATAPNLLASASIGLINKAIGLQFGHLFEIISTATQTKPFYTIQDAGGIGDLEAVSMNLAITSPFSQYFRTSAHPLTNHEINTNPQFRAASKEELDWFNNPSVEMFVSINTKDDWVGLFALGAKSSGEPYRDDDLTMVAALADQLSLALQNARLVDSLMRVNQDFRRAYASMEQSNLQIQQAFSQLEKIDRTKTDFINVASLEMRAPLNVLRSYYELLLEDPLIKNNPQHLRLVKGVQASEKRMGEIIDNMFDVAAIDTRTLQLHIETVSLSFILRNVLETLSAALAERKIDLTVENLRDLPPIQADSDGLHKVFTHLVTNAVKYTPNGGKITISAQVLPPGEHGFSEGGIEIVISDTGIGIDPDNLTLIFQKFYQTGQLSRYTPGNTRFKGSGPGLGLAIAKGIVEAHRGKIWAESPGLDEEKCPGSQFHVVLPLHQPEA